MFTVLQQPRQRLGACIGSSRCELCSEPQEGAGQGVWGQRGMYQIFLESDLASEFHRMIHKC